MGQSFIMEAAHGAPRPKELTRRALRLRARIFRAGTLRRLAERSDDPARARHRRRNAKVGERMAAGMVL